MHVTQGKSARLGNSLVRAVQVAALFVIGTTIVWSAVSEYLSMIQAGHAKLNDIMLLFIYLELGAMVGIYFKTDRLPVLFLQGRHSNGVADQIADCRPTISRHCVKRRRMISR